GKKWGASPPHGVGAEKTANEFQAGLNEFPGTRPEAHIDTPPFDVGDFEQFGGERREIDKAFTERAVSAGFVAVQGAIGIDQMDGADASFELVQKLFDASDED